MSRQYRRLWPTLLAIGQTTGGSAYRGHVSLLDIVNEGPFERPVLVVALDGWVNAGSAGTLAAEALAADGETVAEFDPDALYDYRMNRPVVQFRNGVLAEVDHPGLAIRFVRYGDRDVFVLTGIEPNWNWRAITGSISDFCARFDVADYIGIGGVPWAAPHTRPVAVMTTSTDPDRIPAAPDVMQGLLQVPGAGVNVFEAGVARVGVPTIGFWARVPNYVGSDYPQAAVALLERVGLHIAIDPPLESLRRDATERHALLMTAMDKRPEVKAMVEELEQAHDTALGVSGEDLANEIERFLRGESG